MVEPMNELDYPLRCHLTLHSFLHSFINSSFEVLTYRKIQVTACPEDAIIDMLGKIVKLFEYVVMRKLL